jgi:hypothetical protein
MQLQKAQGAIEYLLIMGAAIMIVALVIIAITNVTRAGVGGAGEDDVRGALTPLEIESHLTKRHVEIDSLAALNDLKDNKTYFLSKNIHSAATDKEALNISNKKNITIDCLGFTISSDNRGTDGTDRYAVLINNNSQGITLKNCKIKGVVGGLYILGSGSEIPIKTENITIKNTENVYGSANNNSTAIHTNLISCQTGDGEDIHCHNTGTTTMHGGQASTYETACDNSTLTKNNVQEC